MFFADKNTTRCFIAFPVSQEVKNEMVLIQSEAEKLNPKMPIKFTEPENLHITVEFLGDLSSDQIANVSDVLSRITLKHHPFKYWLDTIDGFPSLNNPHILLVKVKEEKTAGELLRTEILHNLNTVGIATENHAWRPHITWGRVKKEWHNPVGLYQIKVEPIVFEVKKVILYKSELQSGGPVYTIINTFNLN